MPTHLHLPNPANTAVPAPPARAPRPRGRRLNALLVLVSLALGLLLPAAGARAEPSSADIQKQINRQASALEKIIEDYNRVTEELKATTAAAKKLSATLPGLEQQLATARSDVGEIAMTAYKTGHLRQAEAMLADSGGAALLERVGTLDHLARGRQAQIAAFSEARRRYDAEKQRLDVTLAKERIQMRDLKARKVKIEADLKKLYELRKAAYGREQEASNPGNTGNIPAVPGAAGTAVAYAKGALGKPYAYGAAGPKSFDCSGLTMAAWAAAGKSLPHNAAMQWDVVAHIGRAQLKAGDLVFYSGLGHVAIYVGGSQIIHAPQPAENVKVASVDMMTPYGYGRVR